jgi:hypothetical protein
VRFVDRRAPDASSLIVRSKSPLTTLIFLTLACTVFRLGQALNRSLTVPVDEYERTCVR